MKKKQLAFYRKQLMALALVIIIGSIVVCGIARHFSWTAFLIVDRITSLICILTGVYVSRRWDGK